MDRDGRIKHVKELGKKIPEQPLQGICMYVLDIIYF